jgi:hypothetical protein
MPDSVSGWRDALAHWEHAMREVSHRDPWALRIDTPETIAR